MQSARDAAEPPQPVSDVWQPQGDTDGLHPALYSAHTSIKQQACVSPLCIVTASLKQLVTAINKPLESSALLFSRVLS